MNKAIFSAMVFGIVICFSAGQSIHAQQTMRATQQSDKQLQDCRRAINPDIFPSETCTVILSYLSPADHLFGSVGDDGEFLVLSPGPDGKSTVTTYYLPPKLRSEIALNTLAQTIGDAQYMGSDMHGLFAELAIQGINFWPKMRDIYCYYHPKEKTYLRFSGVKEECPVGLTLPDEKTLEQRFEGPFMLRLNYHTFLNTLQAEEMDNGHSQK